MTSYAGKSTGDLLKLLKQRDATIKQLQAAGGQNKPLTRQEAHAEFLAQKPSKELVIDSLGVEISKIKDAFAKKDHAGDKKVAVADAVKIMKEAGFSDSQADDLAGGYFKVALLDSSKRANYLDFVDELLRMQTYKVMRVLQYRTEELEKKRGEWDPIPKLPVEDIQALFVKSGVGKETADAQMESCKCFQVGRNIKALSIKQFSKWYFYTYIAEEEEKKEEEKKPAEEGGRLDVDKAKAYIDELLKDLTKAVGKPKAMEKGSEEQQTVHFLAGKLMGIMEFAAGGAIPVASDVEKLFADDEATEKLMEKCMACGVKIGGGEE